MFKPHKGTCVKCLKPSVYIVVKAGLCQYCNEAKKKEGRVKKDPKPRQPIKKVSDKRKKLNTLYSILRAQFLKDHSICQARIPNICTTEATTVHHSAGRIGELFLDTTKWKAACLPCHIWVETHPEEAKQINLSHSRLAK